jgi:hypothetical protein
MTLPQTRTGFARAKSSVNITRVQEEQELH